MYRCVKEFRRFLVGREKEIYLKRYISIFHRRNILSLQSNYRAILAFTSASRYLLPSIINQPIIAVAATLPEISVSRNYLHINATYAIHRRDGIDRIQCDSLASRLARHTWTRRCSVWLDKGVIPFTSMAIWVNNTRRRSACELQRKIENDKERTNEEEEKEWERKREGMGRAYDVVVGGYDY